MSDREGTKALFLEEFCQAQGLGCLRLDYSAHGDSEGEFLKGTISSWAADALAVINHATNAPLILVGSSMGGWIMLNLLKQIPDRIIGLVGLAAAPDFTVRIESEMTEEQHQQVADIGYLRVPSEYGPDPYRFSKPLLEDGRTCQHLTGPIEMHCPLRLIHGKQDPDVPWEISKKIHDLATTTDKKVIYIEDGDHRLSRNEDLAVLKDVLLDLI